MTWFPGGRWYRLLNRVLNWIPDQWWGRLETCRHTRYWDYDEWHAHRDRVLKAKRFHVEYEKLAKETTIWNIKS